MRRTPPIRVLVPLAFLLLVAGLSAQDETPPEAARLERVRSLARQVEAKVAAARGLAFREPTKVGVHDRDTLKGFLLANFDAELPPEELRNWQRSLVLLGLLPENLDLKKLFVDLLTEQIAGFYDPSKKELFLVDGGVLGDDENLQRITMNHELVHALQDQHFDLADKLAIRHDDDRVAAIKSVVEGDATLAMMLADTPDMPVASMFQMLPTTRDGLKAMMALSGGAAGLDLPGGNGMLEAPAVIADELIFEYFGGGRFCASLFRRRQDGSPDFSGVDRALRRPPASTEQILHPEKYEGEAADWPTLIELPDVAAALGKEWKASYANGLGELQVRTLLAGGGLKGAELRRSHAGWDGDRYVLLEAEGRPDCLVWVSVWDGETDAAEAATALEKVWAARRPEAAFVDLEGGGRVMALADAGTGCLIHRVGNRLVLADNLPHAARASLVRCLAEGLVLRPMEPPKETGDVGTEKAPAKEKL